MFDKVVEQVNKIFESAPPTTKYAELREEIISNLSDKYNDLIAEGKTPEQACSITLRGIGDIRELIQSYRDQDVFDHTHQNEQRKKTALIVSISTGLYIFSIIALIFSAEVLKLGGVISTIIMLSIIAVATCLIVYHFLSRPKYSKADDTILEEFKEWKSSNNKNVQIRKAISSILWPIVVTVYLGISFIYGIWHISWIIFIIAAAIENIIKLLFSLKE